MCSRLWARDSLDRNWRIHCDSRYGFLASGHGVDSHVTAGPAIRNLAAPGEKNSNAKKALCTQGVTSLIALFFVSHPADKHDECLHC